MTDETKHDGRLDLDALAPTEAETERVVAAVMARLPYRERLETPTGDGPPLIDAMADLLPSAWIAAAAALITAGSILAVTRGRAAAGSDATLEGTVASWTAEQHVPSNAELLATFQG